MGTEQPRLKRRLFGYRGKDVERVLGERDSVFALAQVELATARSKIGQLERELDDLRKEVEESSAATTSARAQLETAKREVRTKEEEARKAQEETRAAKLEHEATRADLESAQRQLDGAKTELGQLREEREELEKRARAAETWVEESQVFTGPTAAVVGGEISSVLEVTERAVGRIIEGARQTSEQELEQISHRRSEIQGEIDELAAWGRRLDQLATTARLALADAGGRLEALPDRIREALEPAESSVSTLRDHLEELAQAAEPPRVTRDTSAPVGPPRIVQLSGPEKEDRSEEHDAPHWSIRPS